MFFSGVVLVFLGAYIVNYLATRGPKMQPFVIASLIQLLCRLTKFGWLDDDRFRDVVKESTNFLEQVVHFLWYMVSVFTLFLSALWTLYCINPCGGYFCRRCRFLTRAC